MLRQSIDRSTVSMSRRRIQGCTAHLLKEQMRKRGLESRRSISSLLIRPFPETIVTSERQQQRRQSLGTTSSILLGKDQHHFQNHSLPAQYRFKSTVASEPVASFTESFESPDENPEVHCSCPKELHRIRHIRNVGVFAHVDAGKTTVTERMLALAGIVHTAGNVDDGNTVTDYLPAERERGITIQSAAIRFPWKFHNSQAGESYKANDNVSIALIDTPGHVDFSVEVNRSVAVLDGAVLVVDSAAGVQAQTQTVWRAMTRPSLNNHHIDNTSQQTHRVQDHAHEPLPCVAVINKMDKIGADFHSAVHSLKAKLPGANPIPIQLPIFQKHQSDGDSGRLKTFSSLEGLIVVEDKHTDHSDEFVGIVDLVHMRAVLWPSTPRCESVEACAPTVIPLWDEEDHSPFEPDCPVTQAALRGRAELTEALAEVDEPLEELYLEEMEPNNADLRQALRRATLRHRALPVMAAAAVQGKGIEPCLDAIADFLPSPMDRMPPALTALEQSTETTSTSPNQLATSKRAPLGHCFGDTLLALAFKVVHIKGRGGSGDGRVVFCRIYSGKLKSRDMVQVITPPALGEVAQKPRTERVGGMLEMAGGRFDNLENGMAQAGDVCALVGLKTVVTGDTIMISPDLRRQKGGKASLKAEIHHQPSFCAGVSSPKPVLTVKLEAESVSEQRKLVDALTLFSIEDPSLVVEDSESATLLSGLGELHIEITLDRLYREYGLNVMVGAPAVKYRETILEKLKTDGKVNFDRTIGDTRLQAAVELELEPTHEACDQTCVILEDPTVTVSREVLEFLGLVDAKSGEEDLSIDELAQKSPALKSLLQGCRGALKRGPGGYAMANVRCNVKSISSEGGLSYIESMPGAIQASSANAVETLLSNNLSSCSGLEPEMSLELSLPNDDVGTVLSDLTSRRGTVGDVFLGDVGSTADKKALVKGEVPLVEILGYANNLRSMTGGEASFTSEYSGHRLCKMIYK